MIFYLMGKSSSGKNTIYQRLLAENSGKLNNIIMYTTRPVRAGEKDGEEYHFVDDDILNDLEARGKVIEKRAYNTVHGTWKYFTVKDESIEPLSMDYLVIGTLQSYISTRDYYGKEAVVPIMIELDDGIRLQRALDREKSQANPKYREMCRRFLADEDDFSQEKLRAAGIEKTFCNEDLDSCLEAINSFMKEY